MTEPNDKAFFCLQQIEGHPDVQHRSTVWPAYRDRLREAGFQAVHAESRRRVACIINSSVTTCAARKGSRSNRGG